MCALLALPICQLPTPIRQSQRNLLLQLSMQYNVNCPTEKPGAALPLGQAYSSVGASALVTVMKYQTQNLRHTVMGSKLTQVICKLLTYCVIRPTPPPTLSGTGNEWTTEVKA